jgi:AraC-like DNA-binding protein
MLYNNPSLYITINFRNHTGCLCQNAKLTTEGLRFCLRCKAASLRKAIAEKETYVGQCYLGITEIVRPIILNDKMVCVIYLGNLILNDKKSDILRIISNACQITGADSRLLINSLQSAQPINEGDLSDYNNILDVLEYLIKDSITQPLGKKKTISPSPMFCSTNHWAIESIQNYILEFYNKDLSLSQLAKLYFLNPDYLCRLFRKETELSFSEYVNNIRIDRAKELLELTNSEIMDISVEVGFANVTYFNRIFKKRIGLSPREYRNSKRTYKEQEGIA